MHNSEFHAARSLQKTFSSLQKKSMAAWKKTLFEQFQDQKQNDYSNFKYLSRPNASNNDLVQFDICLGGEMFEDFQRFSRLQEAKKQVHI